MDSRVRALAEKINTMNLANIGDLKECEVSERTIQDMMEGVHSLISSGSEEDARATINAIFERSQSLDDRELSNQIEMCWGLLNERVGTEILGGERSQYFRQAVIHYSNCQNNGGVTGNFGNPSRDNRCETRLGTLHLLLGELAAAESCFSAVLAEGPSSIEAILGMAETALFLGRYEEALNMIEPMLSLGLPDPWIIGTSASDMLERPEDVIMFVSEARKHVDVGFVSPHRELQLAALECAANIYKGTPKSGPGALGIIADLMAGIPETNSHAIGSAPNALGVRTLVRNTLLSGQVHLLDGLFTARAESVLPGIKGIITDVLEELELVVDDDGEPDFIFIGGSGRCGTTLMRTMLNTHSRIYCGPERKLVGAISAFRSQWSKAIPEVLSGVGGLSLAVLDESCAAFVETLMKSTNDGSPRIAEKTPSVLLYSKFLSNAFPRAKFIHLIRDGRAVVASLLRQTWFDAVTGKPLAYCNDVEAATDYWVEMVMTIRSEAAELGGSYIEVKYEDLVEDTRGVSDKVLAFLGEPWEEGLLEHHRFKHDLPASESSSEEILNPVNSESVSKWKTELKPEDIMTIERKAGYLLRELGYME